MIKIEIKNPDSLSQDYFKKISPPVIAVLELLNSSLTHMAGPSKVCLPIPNFRDVANMTRKLINLLRQNKLSKEKFKREKEYLSTLRSYATRTRKASNANIQNLLDLTVLLLNISNGELEGLLRCAPLDLEKINSHLMKYVQSEQDKDIIKLAFDYSALKKISNEIKQFFRSKNLVNYCPYCNQDPAMYSGLTNGRTVRVHQLDHFYDKSSNPLLSYSIFNLVPGDWNCNSINKHDTHFDKNHHLNPYVAGFGKNMVFIPHYSEFSSEMTKIELYVEDNLSDEIKKRLLGSRLSVDESYKEGNINAFVLDSKYNLLHVREEAARVHRKFLNMFRNRNSLNGFLDKLPVHSAHDKYKFIYEEEIRSPFESARFNDQRYSKLFRDIHDFILQQDPGSDTKLLKEISEKYY